MKAASPALITLLNSGADFQMVDLWTITLVGGAVIRWSGGDVPIVSGGHVYALGPMIERQDISEKIGLDVTTVDMAITADPADLINGVPIIPFIRGHGFDGANVWLDRAFLTDWSLPVVGTVLRFRAVSPRSARLPAMAPRSRCRPGPYCSMPTCRPTSIRRPACTRSMMPVARSTRRR